MKPASPYVLQLLKSLQQFDEDETAGAPSLPRTANKKLRLSRAVRHIMAQAFGDLPPVRLLYPTLVTAHRRHLKYAIGIVPDVHLSKFVHTVFANDLLVESYFWKIRLFKTGHNQLPTLLELEGLLPCSEVKRAAKAARKAGGGSLSPVERQLINIASFVMPAGLFYLMHPRQQLDEGDAPPLFADVKWQTEVLVKPALDQLRIDGSPYAEVMAALLGQPHDGAWNPKRLARLIAVVRSSQNRINTLMRWK